jgi:hypothetical protein
MNSKILFFFVFLFSTHLFPGNDLKIVSSSKESIVFEYTPKITDSSKITINGTIFTRLSILGCLGINSDEKGAPSLIGRYINVGVPSADGNTFQVLSSEYTDIQGMLTPVPRLVKNGKVSDEIYETGDKYFRSTFNDDIIAAGKSGVMRNLRVKQFIIKPVKFDYQSNTIRIYKKIVFKIVYSQTKNNSVTLQDNFLNGVVENYGTAKAWGINNSKAVAKVNGGNSVLNSGKWFRFDAPDEGIYKITKTMLSSYGIDANSVDPRTIKIYNNGGKILSESVTSVRPVDLVENAIIIVGEDDGKFDDNDYILFYGRGINFQDFDSLSGTVKTFFNNYSNHNYFWITSGGEKGKRIQNKSGLNESNYYVQKETKAYLYKKDEKINLAKSGRYFYGDEYTQSGKSNTYSNKLDGILPNSTINYNMSFINSHTDMILLNVDENSSSIYSGYLNDKTYLGETDYSFGTENVFNASFTGTLPDSRSVLKFTFNANEAGAKGYLNYFSLTYRRDLTAASDFLLFYSKDTNSVIEYQLSGFSSSNISVFDVSDYANVSLIDKPVLLSGGEYRFQASESKRAIKKYIALTPASYKTPSTAAEVSNQNIKGNTQGSKLIIITHNNFMDAAKKLKNYRETNTKEKISTSIYVCDQIFNEFSCGSVDVSAIRDFIKYAYDNWTEKPEYVLLLGDGDYDYKNIEKAGRNFVIPWESEQSLHQIYSYCCDDFYSCVSGEDDFADLAIGRINAQTADEANGYINKIISYESAKDQDTWRNLITLIADDGLTSTGDDGSQHTQPSEELYFDYIPRSFEINKIYLAAYPAVLTSLGRRKPAVNQAIIDAINNGSVIINYYGHGNPEVLAHEFVFEKSVTIPALKNSRYFFLTAATCDFGYYDDPNNQSSTELLILKQDGGCIGAISAVRPVYGRDNERLNTIFYTNLFTGVREVDNMPVSVGTAYYKTKAVSNSLNDKKFHLFGDPSIRLRIPQYNGTVDSINGKVCSIDTLTIKSLSKLQLKGKIKKADGTAWSDYNGEGVLTVFDADRTLYLPEISYFVEIPGGVIFNGKISIINGKFSASCVVPKDITHEDKLGKVVLYFYDKAADGVAFFGNVKFGGSDNSIADDKKGPEIEIFFDNPEMKNSELVNSNSTLIVKLSDEVGLNTTGTGVGHKMEGILNKDENSPIDFTNYFTGDLDSAGKSGTVKYKFNNLEQGSYNLKVKAWDVFNNASENSVDFTVVSGNSLEIREIYNYPNPFKTNTTFTFQQNFSVPLDVKIKIYTIAGRLIKELEKKNISEKFVKVDWNGKDQDENQIANGTYLYKIIVKTVDGAYNKTVDGKLAVLR